MTQQAVERALGKLLTDENFRERFFASPQLAWWEAGFALSSIEIDALSRSGQTNQPTLPRPRSPGGRKGGPHMTDQTIQPPVFERQKTGTNGHTSVADTHTTPAPR